MATAGDEPLRAVAESSSPGEQEGCVCTGTSRWHKGTSRWHDGTPGLGHDHRNYCFSCVRPQGSLTSCCTHLALCTNSSCSPLRSGHHKAPWWPQRTGTMTAPCSWHQSKCLCSILKTQHSIVWIIHCNDILCKCFSFPPVLIHFWMRLNFIWCISCNWPDAAWTRGFQTGLGVSQAAQSDFLPLLFLVIMPAIWLAICILSVS